MGSLPEPETNMAAKKPLKEGREFEQPFITLKVHRFRFLFAYFSQEVMFASLSRGLSF